MTSYNKLNGTYVSESLELLQDVLRDDYGFDGIAISDWGSVSDRVKGVAAGMDLEMPTSGDYNTKKIIKAVEEGTLTEEAVDTCVMRILAFLERAQNKGGAQISMDDHHRLAVDAAASSMVLLENDKDLLPLSGSEKNSNHRCSCRNP